jgi:CelD/BcsL family acetyltransferase involved in cellulose biosynthesis
LTRRLNDVVKYPIKETSSPMTTTCVAADVAWKTVNLLNDWQAAQPVWDEFVLKHPKGSIFHTSDMVRVFQGAKNHTPLALAAIGNNGDIIALLVAVRVQTLPDPLGRVSSRSIWYAEPLCYDNEQSIGALAQLVAQHDRKMQRNTLFTEVRPLFAPGPERIALERCGYSFLDYLNFVVDVSQPTDILWRNMDRHARRGVRESERNGFQMRRLQTPDAVDLLYQVLIKTYCHANVPLAHRSLFERAFAILQPKGALKIEAVVRQDEPIAMQATLRYKDLAYAWYCGTLRLRGFSPLDYLIWQELNWSHEQGCTLYDMGGAGWPDEPYGVRRYKAKFGGELVHYGRYRKIYSSWKLALAERAYQIGRKLISPKGADEC